MKTLLIVILGLTLLESCGKKKNHSGHACKSRYEKVMECFSERLDFNPYYTERVCNEAYPTEGCYR